MFKCYILSNVWDLSDLGVEECLDRVQGVGASGVTVVVSSGPVLELRSSRRAAPRVFRSRGGFFFQPDEERYQGTRLKPIVSSWLTGRDPLRQIADGCRRRGLELRVRISVCEVGRLAQRHPQAAAQTVFGDTALVTLCPASPDVRALLRASVSDLAGRYGPCVIELADLRYHSGVLGGEGVEIGFDPGERFLSLLGICFSESSRQAAVERNVDASAAAREVTVALDEVMSSGQPATVTMEQMLAESDILRQYVQCQTETLDALLADLTSATEPGIALVVPAETSGQVLPSVEAARGSAEVVISRDAGEGGTVAEFVARARARWGGEVDVVLELDAAAEAGARPQQLVSTVKEAADAGVAAVGLNSLGLIPEDGFDAVRQAIRYATRVAGV